MIQLPNGCYISEPSVHPSNWKSSSASLAEQWYVHYRFHDPAFKNDPKYKYGLLRKIKGGLNTMKVLELRRTYAKAIIADETKKLKEGYNPIKGVNPMAFTFDLSPSTPFIKALWKAVEKLNYVSISDVKSVIRGVEAAAKELNLDQVPVSQITRKYITVILERCGKLNPRWSARRYNVYRTALIALFKHLIQMEAVDVNPVNDVVKRVETRKIRATLTPEQRSLVNKILYETQYPFWRAIHIFFKSLSRETEIFNVQGKHVDLKNKNCLYTVKKGPTIREVSRPILDDIFPFWVELMQKCGPEDYIFSKGLVPGPTHVDPSQFGRRWKRHVKDKIYIEEDGVKVYINADLYSLKHSFATALLDLPNDHLEKQKAVADALAHTSGKMLAEVYDINDKKRKDDFIRKSNISF